MSIFTQDLVKQTELSLVLIENNPQLQQMLKQIVLRLGIKKSYSFKSVDEFLHAAERPKFDVILLDLPDAETLSGGDWVDQLVYSKVLTPKQQLVLFCQASTHNVLPLEYPYHNVACLSHPFTHAQIESIPEKAGRMALGRLRFSRARLVADADAAGLWLQVVLPGMASDEHISQAVEDLVNEVERWRKAQ